MNFTRWRALLPGCNLFMPGQRRIVENLWHKFFSDPSKWWDHRVEKGNARYPDFKHKQTEEALWVKGKFNPSWVPAELAAMVPGTVQSSSFSWNKRLANYVKVRKYQEAMELFQHLQLEGMNIDKFTFVPVLNACAGLQALEVGRRIHTLIIQSGCESDAYVCSSLINMFCKCGSIEDAQGIFDRMRTRDVVAWNAMILGYVKCGQDLKALELSRQMKVDLVEPVGITYVGLLNACANLRALEDGRRIHKEVSEKAGYELDIYVGSSLIDMYAKCGVIKDARRVFDNLHTRDVVSWNAMIQGYVRSGQGQRALKLLLDMQQEGVEPDSVTFVGLLNACATVKAIEEGRGIHAQIIQSGCQSDLFVSTSLIDMYSKCGSIEDAWRVFKNMPMQNVVSWNAIIQAYLNAGQGWKALGLCWEMLHDGVEPDSGTFVRFVNACTSVLALEEGKLVHEQIIQRGCESDLFVGNSLINMYAKCGSIEDTGRLFQNMPKQDVMTWNGMILGHVKCGQMQNVFELFEKMQKEGVDPNPVTFVGLLNACASTGALKKGRQIHAQIIQSGWESNIFVGTSLVDMYAKCGSVGDAQRAFDKIPTPDVVAWNVMILAHVKCGQVQKALELFQRMQQAHVEPDPITFVGLLNACTGVLALEEGRRVHKLIIQRGCESDVFVASSLIDMYAKCGSIEDAQMLFDRISSHNVIVWTAMLGGYAMHGHDTKALTHFEQMWDKGIGMNEVTFISLLSACSHARLVEEGLCYFESMNAVYGISAKIEHYACMVDLLGRAGHLHEAENLIKTMSFAPSAIIWTTLLGACRVHGNVDLGERIANQLLELDPGNSAGYVLLSNIYAAAGKWESSADVHHKRLERCVKKQPGCTWIEVNNKVHSFTVNDQKHPQITEIQKELKSLYCQMEEVGYLPDVSAVLHDVEDEEKALRLSYHSEKLAIAFGIISTPPGTPLHIFKNLRVCSDCHTATKFITKIAGRAIIVRDANRFHHFEDGICSCKDYW